MLLPEWCSGYGIKRFDRLHHRWKKANVIITKPVNSITNIPYSFGNDVIERVLIR